MAVLTQFIAVGFVVCLINGSLANQKLNGGNPGAVSDIFDMRHYVKRELGGKHHMSGLIRRDWHKRMLKQSRAQKLFRRLAAKNEVGDIRKRHDDNGGIVEEKANNKDMMNVVDNKLEEKRERSEIDVHRGAILDNKERQYKGDAIAEDEWQYDSNNTPVDYDGHFKTDDTLFNSKREYNTDPMVDKENGLQSIDAFVDNEDRMYDRDRVLSDDDDGDNSGNAVADREDDQGDDYDGDNKGFAVDDWEDDQGDDDDGDYSGNAVADREDDQGDAERQKDDNGSMVEEERRQQDGNAMVDDEEQKHGRDVIVQKQERHQRGDTAIVESAERKHDGSYSNDETAAMGKDQSGDSRSMVDVKEPQQDGGSMVGGEELQYDREIMVDDNDAPLFKKEELHYFDDERDLMEEYQSGDGRSIVDVKQRQENGSYANDESAITDEEQSSDGRSMVNVKERQHDGGSMLGGEELQYDSEIMADESDAVLFQEEELHYANDESAITEEYQSGDGRSIVDVKQRQQDGSYGNDETGIVEEGQSGDGESIVGIKQRQQDGSYASDEMGITEEDQSDDGRSIVDLKERQRDGGSIVGGEELQYDSETMADESDAALFQKEELLYANDERAITEEYQSGDGELTGSDQLKAGVHEEPKVTKKEKRSDHDVSFVIKRHTEKGDWSYIVKRAADKEYIVKLFANCPNTFGEIGSLELKSDVSAYAFVRCKNGNKTLVPVDDPVQRIELDFVSPNASQCSFFKKLNASIYTAIVEIGWGEANSEIMEYRRQEMVTCAYDSYGYKASLSHNVQDFVIAQHEQQNLQGVSADANFTIYVANVLGVPIVTDFGIGRLVRLTATMATVDNSTYLGFRALSCLARNSAGASYAVLRGGCGDGIIFEKSAGFTTKGTSLSSPWFRTFKMRGGNDVRFECTFTTCTSNCDGDSCVTT